jgi:hypothetical protein
VTGLNIEDPEAAKKIIKTWDERHDMEIFCESGVDDQVCHGTAVLSLGSCPDICIFVIISR